MAVQIYRFQEHNLVVEGEKNDLIHLAELLRDAEGTIGDLRYQIEKAFNIDDINDDLKEDVEEHWWLKPGWLPSVL